MYNSLSRRRGSKKLADAHVRRVLADARKGKPSEFLGCHARESAKSARGNSEKRLAYCAKLLQRVADPRTLFAAIDYIVQNGGDAPGPNGLHLGDLSQSERWSLVRALSSAIRSGKYRPGPDREAKISKGEGRGMRTLRIPNVEDGVVQRAIVTILQPYLDPQFQPTSLGYRPHKGREHALVKAEVLATSTNNWTWRVEDMADAFNNVPINRLRDVLRKHAPADDFLALVANVIGNDKGKGLRQGGALSPLLLNTYLDRVLDNPWKRIHADTPLVRVADDLLILCTDRDQAGERREALERLLRSNGMALKKEKGALRDLDIEPIEWLGVELRQGSNGLEARLTERSWARLKDALEGTHDKPDAPIRANETIVGWIEQLGPCYPNSDVDEVHARIERTARQFAFEEIPTIAELRLRWERAHERWEQLRADERRTDGDSKILAAPPGHRFRPLIGLHGGALTASAPPSPQ